MQQVLDLIVAKTENRLDCHCVALYTGEGDRITLQALRGIFPIPIFTVVMHYEEGIIGRSVAERQRILIPDINKLQFAPSAEDIDQDHSVYLDPIHRPLDSHFSSAFKAMVLWQFTIRMLTGSIRVNWN